MAVTKIINSESKTYKPVLVDSLVLDAAPTVGSLNGVTSDGVAKAISGSGSVPTPAAGDDGKVLTANDGSYAWAEPTGTEYSAGTGITISEENEIAVTEAISNGAAAGATAVQPAALNDYALSSSLATVATSGSYADLSNKPSIPAAQVNSDWNAVSGVSQILNKPSLATVATTGAYSDLSGTPTIPTVDQNYNAASTNAQSGTAVAQAIAAIPSASYTAGDGIDITANAVSVKAGTGLEIDDVSETVQQNLTCSGIYQFQSNYYAWDICPLTQDIYDAMNTTGGFTLTLSKVIGGNLSGFYLALATEPDQYRAYQRTSGYAILGNEITASAGTTYNYEFPIGTSFTLKLSDYNSGKSNRTLEQVAASLSSYHIVLIRDVWDELMAQQALLAGNNPEVIATCEATTTITDALCVSNPLPASTSLDENKVLTVNSSGSAVWATPQGGGSTYTAGDGIEISAQDAISAKVGNGLEIGNASITVTGTTSGSYHMVSDVYILIPIANLNSTLVSALDGGDVTFSVNKKYAQPSSDFVVPIIYQKKYTGGYYNGINTNYYVAFGDQPAIKLTNHETPANFEFTLNAANVSTTGSTRTWAEVQANPDNFVIALCQFNTTYNVPNPGMNGRYYDYLTGTEANPWPTGTYSYHSAAIGRFINVSNPLPSSAQADANKVLTVNASGDAEWATPATPAPVTVDQTYNAASANAQSGVAVAQAIAAIPAPSVDEVPDVTSYSDAGKVLTASWDLSTGQGSYAWETPNFSVGTWEKINLTNTEYGYYYGDSANGLQKNTMYLLQISVVPASNVPNTVLYLRVAINNSNRDPRGQSVDKVVVRVPWDPTSPSYSGAPFIVTTAIPVSYNPSDSSQPEGTGFAVCASTTSSTSPSGTYLSSVSVQCLPLGSISAS